MIQTEEISNRYIITRCISKIHAEYGIAPPCEGGLSMGFSVQRCDKRSLFFHLERPSLAGAFNRTRRPDGGVPRLWVLT